MSDLSPEAATGPLVYLLLGAPGSGRREVLVDLLATGIDPALERPHVILPAGEPVQPGDGTLGVSPPTRMSWDAEKRPLLAGAPPEDATHVFIVFDGALSPVDQLEAIKPWLLARGWSVARVLTVVNCQLAEKHAALLPWFDACIHFSDVVLLNRREGVANKWLSEFRRRYEDQCLPCLFEFVKAGKVKNPAMLLDPTARRLSQYFDASEWDGLDLTDVEIGESEDDDGKDSRPLDKNAIDPDDQPPVDPWFELDAAGRRRQPVPDMRKYL